MKPSQYRVLIVDDHPIVRQGVSLLIAGEGRFDVCGEAANWGEAMELTSTLLPDAVILDISLGKRLGLDLIRELLGIQPRLRVLVLSMHEEMIYAERSLRAGAHGYVMKTDATHRVIVALDHILAGGVFLTQRVSGTFDPEKKTSLIGDPFAVALASLTNRELEVLSLIGKGMSTEVIASTLNLSVKTVETHRGNIRTKFRMESGDRLLEVAIRYTNSQGSV
jgi:DNA-binding NarL/FixJ family response regulator